MNTPYIVTFCATTAIGWIAAAESVELPWSAVGIGFTGISLLWGAMLKYIANESDRKMAERFAVFEEKMEKKFVSREVFDLTVQGAMKSL